MTVTAGTKVAKASKLKGDGKPWDPLEQADTDKGMLDAVQRREIVNILKSYTGYYDLFSELIQNALDAIDRRRKLDGPKYAPAIRIKIDMKQSSVTVVDNGCGMTFEQFRNFLRPNFSFKDGSTTRGCKGVGATYLGYGFNYLKAATRPFSKDGDADTYAGLLKDGRNWVEDRTGTILRPKVDPDASVPSDFDKQDSGTFMKVKLDGKNIRPKNLSWLGATTASQWLTVLRVVTPLGGVYLAEPAPPLAVQVTVIDSEGTTTTDDQAAASYLFPHEVLGRTADIREFLEEQKKRAAKNQDTTKIPPKFTNLNGVWGTWAGDEILSGASPMAPRLDAGEKKLVEELGVTVYGFLAYSTDLWDAFNDQKLALRKGQRVLRGGLQLATRNMPQGLPITIPLTNNIGFQNITHVVIHMDSAEPDLGRKGFQPEHAQVAGKLAVSAVTALRRYFDQMLRKSTGAPVLQQKLKLEQWIDGLKDHEKKHPLIVSGKGLFMPAEQLPIRSLPLVEQDVVALFNQMLSSGVVRGIQILASSQYEQYDGLFRVAMRPPVDRFTRSATNPLGVDSGMFDGQDEGLTFPVGVLEYKHSFDALVEEFQTQVKNANEVGLAVAWEMGEKWKADFRAVSCLLDENAHHRPFHGVTHILSHATSGLAAFPVVILKDLIAFLADPKTEAKRQRKVYSDDADLDE
jgi:hypothetical protein